VCLVGSGRLSTEQFIAILAAQDRKKAGPTAPAGGLFLEQVHYEEMARR
ncbi:MAG: tRNA pseudouridine(38-40) synthase TruA, partial [Candidatus Electrothrix sp. AUS1_2]|nr:tRNA pseudouridine(38-40) synthase TruA [Candidatus Electrothrix sp. AUS1_2]